MFILTAWGEQRELICHKESNTVHAQRRVHTQTQACTLTHTHAGACQCTLRSYSPGVKSFWDDPQNTLLRSMQHTHAHWSPWVGMGQDIFHRQLSPPTPLYECWMTNRSKTFAFKLRQFQPTISRFSQHNDGFVYHRIFFFSNQFSHQTYIE